MPSASMGFFPSSPEPPLEAMMDGTTGRDTSSHLRISEATTDAEIARCFPVMSQLRTRLREDEFVARVRLQQSLGYHLACLEDAGEVVDDLVTDGERRSKGYGATLLAWLADRARAAGCAKLDLDSGVQRKDAHRFYHAQGMTTFAHHFRMDL